MKVLWTPQAAQDLSAAVDYIAFDKPYAAVRVANRIYEQVTSLARMPNLGRVGAVPGTRELIFHPWLYIAV
jgi:plasmid stabilization system protein ParE